MFFETDALVLKTNKSLNNDLFLTLFSRKAGKIDVVANGAKSSKSQLAACSKPFVYGNFVMNTHNKMMKITSCDIHDSHFRIADRLDTLAYGNYFIELCNLTTMPNVVDFEHYQLIVEIISILSKKELNLEEKCPLDFELLRLAYLIKLSALTGHSPNLSSSCSNCGVETENIYFSINAGGVICSHCEETQGRGYKLNKQFIGLINYLLIKDIRIIMKTKIHENYVKHLLDFFESFVLYHNNISEIKSKSFLDDVM